MAEIAEEVRLRRASGDLPPRLERELDELFLAHSPIGVRGGDLAEALRQVDAATFIDPVVPVESERAAGAFVKKGMRSLLMWYVGWLTHQMSQSASAMSRALHIVDDRLKELERAVEAQKVSGGGVVEFAALAGRRELVGRAGAGRPEQGAGAGAARGVRRRLAGAPAGLGGCRRLRGRPAVRTGGPGRAGGAGPAGRGRGRPPAGGGGVRTGRRGAERGGRGPGRRGADAAADRRGQPARPGRDAAHPFGHPGDLGVGRCPVGGRPGGRAPVAGRDLVRAAEPGRLHGHGGGRTRRP